MSQIVYASSEQHLVVDKGVAGCTRSGCRSRISRAASAMIWGVRETISRYIATEEVLDRRRSNQGAGPEAVGSDSVLHLVKGRTLVSAWSYSSLTPYKRSVPLASGDPLSGEAKVTIRGRDWTPEGAARQVS